MALHWWFPWESSWNAQGFFWWNPQVFIIFFRFSSSHEWWMIRQFRGWPMGSCDLPSRFRFFLVVSGIFNLKDSLWDVPHSYRKSPCSIGKSSISMVHFQSFWITRWYLRQPPASRLIISQHGHSLEGTWQSNLVEKISPFKCVLILMDDVPGSVRIFHCHKPTVLAYWQPMINHWLLKYGIPMYSPYLYKPWVD